ncbi:MAG: indole-3-glycerol phosphate synthase TrpC [Kistimonas sp.]|nr:indole-3-glycerol phosphate synthase TrpC [Kistimonas sp.]
MTQTAATILQKIVTRKRAEIAGHQNPESIADLCAQAAQTAPPRGFGQALRARQEKAAVVAEIKRASPSCGIIRKDFDPAALAHSYEQAGATCLSVLTDRDFFNGDDDHLRQARAACSLPVLRKDFVIAPSQIYQARALGADCILLIVAILEGSILSELHDVATGLGMDVLIEVHTASELERARTLLDANTVLGINNRDLHSFSVSLETSCKLRQQVPEDQLVITESGIHTPAHVELMQANGINAFLVGEALMREQDPGQALKKLFSPWL